LPKAFSVSSRAFSTAEKSVTSTPTAMTFPLPESSFAVRSAKALSRSQIATAAPPSMKRSTTARPMPWAPPVTTPARLVKSYLMGIAAPLPRIL
jgi:hypothetical protein